MARPPVSAWTRAAVIAWLAVLLLSFVSYARNWGASKAIFRALGEGGCLVVFVVLFFSALHVARTFGAKRDPE